MSDKRYATKSHQVVESVAATTAGGSRWPFHDCLDATSTDATRLSERCAPALLTRTLNTTTLMLTAFLLQCSNSRHENTNFNNAAACKGVGTLGTRRAGEHRSSIDARSQSRRSPRTPKLLDTHRLCRRELLMCTSPESGSTQRPRVSAYTSQRAVLSSDKKAFTPAEFNDLLVRCNESPRDERKILRCLKYSFSVVSARLLGRDQRLVAVVRSVSDGAMNATLWDVLVDPNLPNPLLMRLNIIRRMLDDLNRSIPLCSVAIIAPDELVPFYEKECNFVTEPNGIQAMVLVRWPENLDQLEPIEVEDDES